MTDQPPREQPRRGRRTIMTPQITDRILDAVRLGLPLDRAALYAGISPGTLHDWIARGNGTTKRRQTPAHVQFVEALAQVRPAQEVARIAAVETAARGGAVVERTTIQLANGRRRTTERRAPPDWRAAAFLLERTQPETWGARERLEVTGRDGEPVELRVVDERAVARKVRAFLDETGGEEDVEDAEVVEDGPAALPGGP